jgi:tetratricopeptide (TPR) repeat protein
MDINKKLVFKKIIYLFILLSSFQDLFSQASIREYNEKLKTYDFKDPNPIPIFISDTKIYPYFSFDGYDVNPSIKEFKVIELENNYIKVLITPELGGKVWGAIEKSTGEEFIYKNEVVKFRNISMRGPWTSGGIEFNFGIIGHHPSTATPVDYTFRKNDDGSVSCFVGNIDLPSRTQWRVEVKVDEEKASFITNALWYNPSPTSQSYYNWMTAAAPARNDLHFYTPGDMYLEHNGNVKSWPLDSSGRDLSKYRNNDFGPSKSYHIVGEYNDFFGGYYHDSNYGFGHWGRYEDIPGQKLWLWSQSRAGGIWEDLLTDNDGQYIEFQAGRLFVQYTPTEEENPISNVRFEPYRVDRWKEAWFPLKHTGGLSDASEFGALNVIRNNDSLTIKLNPFIKTNSLLEILVDGEPHHEEILELDPMDVYSSTFFLERGLNFNVKVDELGIDYESEKSKNYIERSFLSDETSKYEITDQKLFQQSKEDIAFREYKKAEEKLNEIIEKDKFNLDARYYLGEIYFKTGQFNLALDIVKEGLKLDTYHPSLNYVAGITYKELNDNLNGKEALGWAARSIEYRSNAYSQIADIFLREKNYLKAMEYAERSLEYNINNIPSIEIIAISNRYLNKEKEHNLALLKIDKLDPLNHIIAFERFQLSPNNQNKIHVINSHRSELSYQTYLELAISYYNRGLIKEAITILEIGPDELINNIWKAYLKDDREELKNSISSKKIDFSFPFRRESIKILEWAKNTFPSWKLDYLLSLNLWGKGRYTEAKNLLIGIKDISDNHLFYLNRGLILNKLGIDPRNDFIKAYELDNKNWRVSRALSDYHFNSGNYNQSNAILRKAFNNDKSNYIIGMDYVKTLVKLEKFSSGISILDNLNILPYEHSGEGRELYTNAYFGLAIKKIISGDYKEAINIINKSKIWPENLGVGKPFNPDERIQDYLMFYCKTNLGDLSSKKHLQEIIEYTEDNINKMSVNHILGFQAIKIMQGEEESESFINKLNSKHKSDSDEMNFINNFKRNGSSNSYKKFDLLRKILLLK